MFEKIHHGPNWTAAFWLRGASARRLNLHLEASMMQFLHIVQIRDKDAQSEIN